MNRELPNKWEWFRTRDGLPHSNVTAVIQDRQGYLWIGTYNGLCRYDGFEFKLYQQELSSGRLNTPHAIESLFEDAAGNIWVGTRGGVVACFNRKSNTWISYFSPQKTITAIHCFFEDSQGKIWIGSREGHLGKLDVATATISFQKVLNSTMTGIAELNPDELILCGLNFYRYSKRTGKLSPFPGILTSKQQPVQAILLEKNLAGGVYDSLFTGRENSAGSNASKEAGRRKKKFPGNSYHKDRLIAFSGSTLLIFKSDGTCLDAFSYDGLEDYTQGVDVNDVYLDRDNILWMATNSGLLKLDKDNFRFESLLAGSPTGNYVRSIYEVNNQWWIGLRQGQPLLWTNGQNDKVVGVRAVPTEFSQVLPPTINCFLKTRSGDLYSGGLEGVGKYDERSGKLIGLTPGGKALDYLLFQEIWCLFEDKEGNLWMGTNRSGLFIWNLKQNTYLHFTSFPGVNLGNNESFSVWSILEDHSGEIWLGTSNGLYAFSNRAPVITKECFVHRNAFGSDVLNGYHAWNLFEDSRNRLWVGTTDEGANIVSADRNSVGYLNSQNGLPTNVVSSITEDNFGNIWLATMNGLLRQRPDGKIEVFTEHDGLLSNDFNFKAVGKDSDGRLYFGTKLGVVTFRPEQFGSENVPGYPPVLTEFMISGVEINPAVWQGEWIDLAYWQNFFQFRFSLLKYQNPFRHAFRYKLEGFEKQWNVVSAKSPYARYTQVPPGEYTLRVEASSDGINWYPTPLIRTVRIHPALWQQRWFWVGVGVLLIALISWLIRRRFLTILKREKEANRFMRRLGELELQALQAQMNPHFIFNSINSIQHYVLSHDEVAANDYLTNFARLMRLFLQSSRHKYISLRDELDILDKYIKMEVLRFEEKFNHTIEIAPDVPLYLKIPTMILQPFVENSINHGLLAKKEKGNLVIRFSRSGNSLCCIIDDDGIGREKAGQNRKTPSEHHSMGMGLIQERLKIYEAMENMEVKVKIVDKRSPEGYARGTMVEICIPINNWNNESSNN